MRSANTRHSWAATHVRAVNALICDGSVPESPLLLRYISLVKTYKRTQQITIGSDAGSDAEHSNNGCFQKRQLLRGFFFENAPHSDTARQLT